MPTLDSPVGAQRLAFQTQARWRTCRKRSKVGILSFAIRLRQIPNMLQATHLTNFIFDGARADLMKGLSMDPAFQVTHSFQLASQSVPPTYTFGALFANPKVSDGIPVHIMLFLSCYERSFFKATSTTRAMSPDDCSKVGLHRIPRKCRHRYAQASCISK